MDLYHLIYQSQALGLLLHTDDGRFLQVLEGPKTAVRHLFYHVILSDTRHFHCHVISEGLCFRRNFSDWTMGCRVALPGEMRQLLGEAAPTDSLGLATRPYPRAQLLTLLQAFVSQGEEAAGQPHPLDSPATGPTR
jgi:hypothetical protein